MLACFLSTQELRIFSSFASVLGPLQDAGRLLASDGGFNLSAVVTPSFFELRAVNVSVENSRGILDYYDGYLVPAEALPEMALAGLIAPLDHIIMET